jgi:tetratricopeptide (TPR) repeat protein
MTRWITLMSAVVLVSSAVARAPEGGVAEAQRRFESGQYEEADEAASKLLEKNGADAEARLLRSRARCSLRRYDAALADVEALLKADSTKREYFWQRGTIRIELGQFGEGFADMARAADCDKDEVKRAASKAMTQMLFAPDAALKTLADAIAAHPDAAQLYATRSSIRLIRIFDMNAALTDARTARDLAPDNPQYADGYANALISCGRTQAGRDEATAALVRFPKSAELYETRARANLMLKQVGAATADALRSVQLKPTSWNGQFILAKCHVAAAQYGEAVLDYQTAYEFARKDPERWPGRIGIELSRLLSRCPDAAVRNGAVALRFAEQVKADGLVTDDAIADALASAYAELGQFDKAVEIQEMPVRRRKGNPAFKCYADRLELYKQGKPCRETTFER